MAYFFKNKKGFTFIEIVVVVALISILVGILYVAINHSRNFADTRNDQRSADITEILDAITSYSSDDGHSTNDFGIITLCPLTSAIGIGAGNINLAAKLVDSYIVRMPKDPIDGTDADTGYTICTNPNGRLTIGAPGAENGKTISVKR